MQKLAELCIRRPVFATMLIMALVVMGLASYRNLGVDFFPKVEFPIINVSTTLRGAAPEEVETQVSKRIEEAVNTISGIDDLRSNSSEGISIVSIQFMLDKDPDIAAQEVRDKISAIASQLPNDADPPVVQKLATDASPVINVVFASNRDLRETTKLVDDRVKKNIESLPGVGQVRFVGDRQRQIQVWLDGEKLYSYNLNIDQVRTALAAQNVEIPGGRVDQGSRELSLRTLGRVEKPQDFARIIVANVGGSPVRLADVGRVVDGAEETRSLARLDGTPAVVLEVRKQAGTNTLAVINTIKERVGEVMQSMPPDFKVSYTRDQSEFISDSFHAVQEHLILGGFLAAIVVLLFMRNWRSTLIAAVAIPTSIISTYTMMSVMGFTLNQITMLALVLTVGIVIDDAIVVLENIFKFAEERGLRPMEAALEGTRDIGTAVLATTLSLAIIFMPVALMAGMVGKFMSSFGYTAAFAVMVSMLVSFTLTPMLCSRFLKPSTGKDTKDTLIFRAFAVPYRAMLNWSMDHRWVIVIVCLIVMFSSIPLFMIVGKDFLPTDDQSEFEVTVRTPPGSSLQGTDEIMKQVEEDIRQLPGIRTVLTTIGADIQKQVDRASIIVELLPIKQRKETQAQLMIMARERLRRYKDLVIGVQLPSLISGGTSDREFMFYVQGPDLSQLNRYSSEIMTKLRAIPGLVDLDSSYEAGKPELRVRINRDKAADLNVNVSSVATALRTLVGGDPQATSFRDGDDRYDVQLRVDEEFRNSRAALDRLYVPSASLGNVPISNVASLETAEGPVRIERYNRQRQIMISANLSGGQSLSNVIETVNKAVDELNMPPEYRTGLVGRSKEFGRAGVNYVIALMLSIVFMYMVLAAQFESFIDPVTILLSLPLSVPFALISLILAGENFSIIYSSVGILVLFGIVKKNSILQVDHIKSLRRGGMERRQAILHGCEDRLRPILMTTAALVAGMIPMALGGGAGSGSRRTVAIVVIGGQTLCLVLTLLITPVAYSLFDDLGVRLGKMFSFSWRPRFPFTKAARATPILMLLLAFSALSLQAETQKPATVRHSPMNATPHHGANSLINPPPVATQSRKSNPSRHSKPARHSKPSRDRQGAIRQSLMIATPHHHADSLINPHQVATQSRKSNPSRHCPISVTPIPTTPYALGSGASPRSRPIANVIALTLLFMPLAFAWRPRLTKAISTTTMLLLAAFSPFPLHAENQKPAPAAMDAPARIGVSVTERRLTLAEAVETALKHNLDLEIERTNVANAAQAIKAATGAFDPTFRYTPGFVSNNTPTASILQGADGRLTERGFTNNASLRQRLPWTGGIASLDFDNARQTSTNAFASLNPLVTSRLVIGFTQPLLRNREYDLERTEIKLRRKQAQIVDVDFEVRAIDVVTRVEQAYWDLVASRQDVQVTQDAVELARQQYSRNERMIESGTLAPIELSASRAELERRLDSYLASIGVLTEIENNLKMLIAPDRGDPIWSDQLIPTDMKSTVTAEADDFRAAVEDAIKRRPELRQVALRQESNLIDQTFAREQLKPQLNIVTSYANQGLGGALRPGDNPISASQGALYQRLNALSAASGLPPLDGGGGFGALPGTVIGGYGTALSSLFGGNYQSLQAGVQLDFNFRNRVAEAQLSQTAIAERRLKLERARAEQTIEAQVRNALQTIQTARQRIAAAQAGEVAAKEKLDSETRLFQTGESTNFFVLTRQNEYLDARRRAVLSQLDFNKAVARLEQSLGRTLKTHNLSLR